MVKQIINEQGQGFNCESTCDCVTPVFGTGQYQTELDCINSQNCCKRWKCDPNGAGVCEAVNDMSAPYETENDCLSSNPNGCQQVGPEICCDVWVCADSGKFNKCCKPLQLCKPQGAPIETNYPNGFPWNLVESSSVPPKEFNKILKENLLLEWMCNMDWVTHFGVWLSSTKLDCEQGPPWISYQSIPGGQGCGSCLKQADIDKEVKFSDDENIKIKTNDILKGKDAEEYIENMRDSGRIERLNEDFFKGIVTLVEDVYHTQKLLKG